MLGQKNITHVVVGKDTALVAESATRASMTAGQIGVFKAGSTTAINGTTDLVAGDRFKVVFKNVDGYLVESPLISYDNIIYKNAVAYAADAEQKTYIGYNGTTGSIAVANSDEYYIHLDRKDSSKTWGEHTLYKLLAAYKSDATATQTEIADALVLNAVKNLAIEKMRSGRAVNQVGRINSAAVTAANDLVNNATVVKGTTVITSSATAQVDTITLSGTSGTANVAAAGGLTKLASFDTDLATTAENFVTTHAAAYAAVGITLTFTSTGATDGKLVFTAAVAGTDFTNPTITNATGDLAGAVANTQVNVKAFEYAAAGATVAAGDYLRIGSINSGTALTSNVYKVKSVSGTTGTATVTLDIPILEASGTYAAATSDIEVIPAATGDAANWGLMVESLPVKFVPGLFKNQQVTFEVSLSEAFGNTLVTLNTAPSKGSGTYQEVAENEWFLSGNKGEPYRVADYPVSKNLNATSGKTYDTITLHYTNDNANDLNGKVHSWASLVIYTEDESNSTVHTNLKDVFNIS